MNIIKNSNNLNLQLLNNLDTLKDREKEILILRFGLDNNKDKTLQTIGNNYKITRERIRQIVNHILQKIKNSKNKDIIDLINKIEKIIADNGGIISENNMSLNYSLKKSQNANLGVIEILCRINPNIIKIKKTKNTQNFWALKPLNPGKVSKINKILTDILIQFKKVMSANVLYKKFLNLNKDKISQNTIMSVAKGSNNILFLSHNNIGLSDWPEINPKNTRDKIHYILKENGKPLHFREITAKISEKKFANKFPTQTTVHNELISDNRFVLIGRGIYALRKWGFEPGTVVDLIKKELLKSKNGLDQNELCDRILKKRMISKNTIIMNLNSHQIFYKNESGHWKIKNSQKVKK